MNSLCFWDGGHESPCLEETEADEADSDSDGGFGDEFERADEEN